MALLKAGRRFVLVQSLAHRKLWESNKWKQWGDTEVWSSVGSFCPLNNVSKVICPFKKVKTWCVDTCRSQRFVSSQVGSFMFLRTRLTILSSSFLARCSSSSVLFILLLSWRTTNKEGGGREGKKRRESQNIDDISNNRWRVLIKKQTHLFQLLHFILETVHGVHQTPAETLRTSLCHVLDFTEHYYTLSGSLFPQQPLSESKWCVCAALTPPTSPPPQFVRCSSFPPRWSSPPLGTACERPSCWSLVEQRQRWKLSTVRRTSSDWCDTTHTHTHFLSLQRNREIKETCCTDGNLQRLTEQHSYYMCTYEERHTHTHTYAQQMKGLGQ